MPRPLNHTVMRGGPSAEREVSLASGAAVATALRGFVGSNRPEETVTSDRQSLGPNPGVLL